MILENFNKKKYFEEFVKAKQRAIAKSDEAINTNILDIDFIFSLREDMEDAADQLFELLYGTPALDWVNWYIYEASDLGPGSNVTDSKGNPIPSETIDDLWNIVNNVDKSE